MKAAGKRYILYASRKDTFTIWNLSDLHLGNAACAEDRLRADIRAILDDPFSFWVGGGDMVDFIGYRDIRFDPDAVAPWLTVRDLGNLGEIGMKKARDFLAPIKHKCLGLLIGNHEKKYQLRTEHEALHGWLCTELGAPDLGYCALFDLVFVRDSRSGPKPSLHMERPRGTGSCSTFRFFVHHGAGYAQTPGGKLNRLVQFMQSFDADVYMVGHVHDQVGRREPAIGANAACDELVARERLGIISGSYLKTYAENTTTYGEQRGYRPTVLGAASVTIHPASREIHANI